MYVKQFQMIYLFIYLFIYVLFIIYLFIYSFIYFLFIYLFILFVCLAICTILDSGLVVKGYGGSLKCLPASPTDHGNLPGGAVANTSLRL